MTAKITLARADFDALPIHHTPPDRITQVNVWKTGVGRLWFHRERKKDEGFIEIVIREIVIDDRPAPNDR